MGLREGTCDMCHGPIDAPVLPELIMPEANPSRAASLNTPGGSAVPEIPEEAVRAAVAAYAREGYCDGEPIDGDERVIRCTLEAAASLLAEAVARKILAHMEAHGPRELGTGAWRRHFRIAAQVAAGAFSTDEDLKRQAAEALNRGDYMACYLDDTGNPVAGKREDGLL